MELLGRRRELECIRSWLQSEASWIVVMGAPGVGKTTLLEGALDSSLSIWLDLAHVSSSWNEALASMLGLANAESFDALVAYLKLRPELLIVWDNAEVFGGRALHTKLQELREAGVENTFFVLTREEEIWGEDAHVMALLGLEIETARALFASHAESDELPSEALVQRLESHPLSLILWARVARWVGVDAVARMIASQDASIGRVALLQESLHRSWERLTDGARTLLGRMCDVSFVVHAQDLEVLGHDLDAPFSLVAELTRGHLVQMHEKEARIVPSVRAYVQVSAPPSPSWWDGAGRMLLERHAHQKIRWQRLDDMEVVEMLRRRHALFLACSERAVGLSIAQQLELSILAWHTSRHYGEGSTVERRCRAMLERLTPNLDADGVPWEAVELRWLMWSDAFVRTRAEVMLERLAPLLEIATRRFGARADRLWWELEIMWFQLESMGGLFEEASRRVKRLREVQRECASDTRQWREDINALLEKCVANHASMMFDFEVATRHYQRSIAMARRIPNMRTVTSATLNYGLVLLDDASWDTLLPQARACEPYLEYVSRGLRALFFVNMSEMSLRLGDFEGVQDWSGRAEEALYCAGLVTGYHIPDVHRCTAHLDRGEHEEAERILDAIFAQRFVGMIPENTACHLWFLRIRSLCDRRRYNEAWRAIEEELVTRPDGLAFRENHFLYELLCVMCLGGLGRVDEARAVLDGLEPTTDYYRAMCAWQHVLLELHAHNLDPEVSSPTRWLEPLSRCDVTWLRRSDVIRGFERLARAHAPAASRGWLEAWGEVVTAPPSWWMHRDGSLARTERGEFLAIGGLLARFLEVLGEAQREGSEDTLDVEALAARVWPGEYIEPQSLKNRVHAALSKLRQRGFGPVLERHGHGYRMNPQVRWVS